MKILWLCNLMPPVIAEAQKREIPVYGGWLDALSRELIKKDYIQLCICFPMLAKESPIHGEIQGIRFYGIPLNIKYYKDAVTETMRFILKEECPDAIQIFGTEYPHSLSMLKACESLKLQERTLVTIQGIISVYVQHYMQGIPASLQKLPYTLRDCIKGNSVNEIYQDLCRRSEWEKKTLQKAKHVVGRTFWDQVCCSWLAPNAQYSYCGEILRKEFYDGSWDYNKCEKRSIFVSQSNYAIKGFHRLLQALPLLLQRWPDLQVYTTGQAPRGGSWLNKQRNNSYFAYLKKIMEKSGLENHIHFMGELNAQKMKERLLLANVFVSPSSIENSSNSVAEAMSLGVPVVCSMVGGAQDILVHEKEGYLYQADAPYMLAGYIDQIFSNHDTAQKMGRSAALRAARDHSKEKVVTDIIQIYDRVTKNA